MRMRRMSFLFTLAAAVLAGCANAPLARPATLTYETTPEGATLYESGQAIGTAPVTRTYPSDGKADTIRTPLVTAVWPSGAKESYYTLVPPGADRVATIARPANAPGLQADLDNAKKVVTAQEQEAKRIKEQQARDVARASARCKSQQAGTSKAVVDDCN